MPNLHARILRPIRSRQVPLRIQSHSIRNRTLSSGADSAGDDFYSLLLEDPTPNPSQRTIKHQPTANLETPNSPSNSGTPDRSASDNRLQSAKPQILFSTPLSGPSPRMRGLARAEKGLERPPEPENCCMSGCVNCVWDAYREEVEEWAAARREREAAGRGKTQARARGTEENAEGGVGDLDEVSGKLDAYKGVDVNDEGALFEGVPIGIREFMATEKRLRERRERSEAG